MNQTYDNNLLKTKDNEGKIKNPKGLVASILLGAFSIYFAILSLFSSILTYFGLNDYEDKLKVASLIFSIILFAMIGVICGIIGFLKAKIVTKGGNYCTTGLVLNFFGTFFSVLEIILGFTSLFILS